MKPSERPPLKHRRARARLRAAIFVGHGSRARGFDAAMKKVARAVERSGRFGKVTCAYLEINSPNIPDAIRSASEKGASDIRVLPYFVLNGRHVKSHIPKLVAEGRRGLKSKVRLCSYLGFDRRLVELAVTRLERP